MTEQQWLKIYRETIHSLYGYIAKRTGRNRELTEDIIQESYLRALNSWKRKKTPDSPLAWLNRVARNILIDYLRKKRWESDVDLDVHSDTGSQTSENQIKSLEMFMAISSLGQKKANIIEAFYYEGKSVRDIANEMKISERAVEGHLRRARQSLKSLLPQQNQNGGKNE
ncbi:MAG: sigma-70 family RNA polymerase sigma factor [Candidatus Aminicenantes bacterium]|nr:sigma-70 family RNA polymerase sigma factor [Candidatus Aminicenantes bacterium]